VRGVEIKFENQEDDLQLEKHLKSVVPAIFSPPNKRGWGGSKP
jgi:hypothetical protein